MDFGRYVISLIGHITTRVLSIATIENLSTNDCEMQTVLRRPDDYIKL